VFWYREELYGAVLHSLVTNDRKEDAEKLFQSMEKKENGIDVLPGPSCFGALILSSIRRRSWDEAISVYDRMREQGVVASPQAVQGLIMASSQKNGQSGVMSIVESFVQTGEVQITESTFRLITRTLYKEVQGPLHDFRRDIRNIGENDPSMRDVCLNLIRSIRVAEIESHRQPTPHKTVEEMKQVQDKAWLSATSHLIKFIRVINQMRESDRLE
jgi:pentatricopeptide repeat protein